MDALVLNGTEGFRLPRLLDPKQGRNDGMLILTRRVGETLMIGDEVTVTVLGVKGNQVRIGVNAPKEVSVHRQEMSSTDRWTAAHGNAVNRALFVCGLKIFSDKTQRSLGETGLP